MATTRTLNPFPMTMKFSFGFKFWFLRNPYIKLETCTVKPESIHQVLEGTTIKFDLKHTQAKGLPFF